MFSELSIELAVRTLPIFFDCSIYTKTQFGFWKYAWWLFQILIQICCRQFTTLLTIHISNSWDHSLIWLQVIFYSY